MRQEVAGDRDPVGSGVSLHLSLDPREQQIDDALLFGRGQIPVGRHGVPFLQALAATAGASMLRYKNRMPAHGGLFAVVRGMGRGQSLPDKILSVAANDIHSFFRHICTVFGA